MSAALDNGVAVELRAHLVDSLERRFHALIMLARENRLHEPCAQHLVEIDADLDFLCELDRRESRARSR